MLGLLICGSATRVQVSSLTVRSITFALRLTVMKAPRPNRPRASIREYVRELEYEKVAKHMRRLE